MMLADSASCPACEREHRDAVLSAEDARWVISFQGPETFVRAAWILASETTNAATGLDMRTGAVIALRWGAGEDMPMEETEDLIILAHCPAHRKAELPKLLEAGAEESLSAEDAEELAREMVVRSALGDGGRRFWEGLDVQLRKIKGLRQRS